MSDAALTRQEELKAPPSPTTKVSKWLGSGKVNDSKKTEHTPISATANLNKLRDRLLAIRNETGSFSSSGSERIAPNTENTASPSNDALLVTRSSKGAWRIAAQSSEKDATFTASTSTTHAAPPVAPSASKPQAVSSSRKATPSAALPPRSPPRRSSSRLNPQPSPRTPPRSANSTPPPPSSSYNTPRQLSSTTRTPAAGSGDGNGGWEEQLGVLDRLSKQLSITASQLSEDSPEKQRALVQQRARRSSVADWQKYQDLAAKLEEARSQLQDLDSSNDEVSFAALLEDK